MQFKINFQTFSRLQHFPMTYAGQLQTLE